MFKYSSPQKRASESRKHLINLGRRSIDPAATNIMNEIIIYGSRPTYIVLELDHQYDEFHGYDGFDCGANKYKDTVKPEDIYSIVYQAINNISN